MILRSIKADVYWDAQTRRWSLHVLLNFMLIWSNKVNLHLISSPRFLSFCLSVYLSVFRSSSLKDWLVITWWVTWSFNSTNLRPHHSWTSFWCSQKKFHSLTPPINVIVQEIWDIIVGSRRIENDNFPVIHQKFAMRQCSIGEFVEIISAFILHQWPDIDLNKALIPWAINRRLRSKYHCKRMHGFPGALEKE